MEANPKFYLNRNYQISMSGSLMVMMIAAPIVPAFPKIISAFGISEQSVGLLLTAYTLPCFFFGPLGGVMADRVGRKRLLVTCLFLFGIFGVSCTFATSFTMLIVLRVFQGISGASLAGISTTIISDLYSGHQRAAALGLNTTVMYLGYIIYPVIGGALASLGWNYTFLIHFLAIILGFMALFGLHCPEPKNHFTLKQYLGKSIQYVKSWKVLWLFLSVMIAYIILYGGFLAYFSILLGGRFHAPPFTIGIFIAVVGVMTAIASLAAGGKLIKRFTAVSLVAGAFVIYAFSMIIIPFMPDLWFCLVPIVIYGFAHGLNLPSLNFIGSRVTPLEHRAGFMALQGAMITLGMTISPLIMGFFYSFTNLDLTFILTGLIALIIPALAVVLGKERLAG